MRVDLARQADLPAVMNVLDGAALDIAATTVEAAIGRDRVLVARSTAGTVLGVLVGDEGTPPVRILAIAVRPGRRGRGIGSALIESARRWGALEAAFDPDVAPFYRTNGFTIECEERCFGRLAAPGEAAPD